MKRLPVLLLVLICIAAVNVSGQPDKRSSNKQSKSQEQGSTADPANANQNANAASESTRSSDATPAKWYAAIKRPEWLTAIAAVITLVIVAWQSYETRRAASASKESAEAFINKERARLFISHQVTVDFVATFKAINQGQSPAQMIYSFVGCHILKVDENFPVVPDYTEGDDPKTYVKNTWVLPGDDAKVGWYDASYISESDNPQLLEDVTSGGLLLWFYGVVRYIDSVSLGQHELRFCYRCWPGKDDRHFLFEGGPETYRTET